MTTKSTVGNDYCIFSNRNPEIAHAVLNSVFENFDISFSQISINEDPSRNLNFVWVRNISAGLAKRMENFANGVRAGWGRGKIAARKESQS